MTRNLSLVEWHPASWHGKRATQQPAYADQAALASVLNALSALPPIVVSWEVESLKEKLAAAQRGEQFVLQGGDCAESFYDCNSDVIARKLKVLLQMSLMMAYAMKKPIVRIGRMAGQYAKPRSVETETRNEVQLPAYRGDIVNRPGFSAQEREADPTLLLRGYERSALTLNLVRALVDGGFADLHHPEYWDLQFVQHSPSHESYQRLINRISESLQFFEGATGKQIQEVNQVEFYVSHEGVHLLYEQAQTRYVARQQRWYNLATHAPWIGMRTAAIDGAHVEYFRGIANPIGVKIGPSMTPEWLQGLVAVLNPQAEPGRLTLIHRMGTTEIEKRLPPLINAVRATGSPVLWICDPMHGNTEVTHSGQKTRQFGRILTEVDKAFRIHREMGSILGGLHIELTGDDVTECTGGARGLTEADLPRAYRSSVDPRLNGEQALELAMRIAELYRCR